MKFFLLASSVLALATTALGKVEERQKMPDLSKLSPCALTGVLGALTSVGCKGPTDSACLCTAKFANATATALGEKCKNEDSIAGLAVLKDICPDLPLPDLSHLTTCGTDCVLDTLKSNKCAGPLDPGCICTNKFTTDASTCLISKCGTKDTLAGLDLVKGMCPKVPLPDLSKMTDCGKNCVVDALKTRNCKGPLDTACLCNPDFTTAASGCLINGCGTKDTLAGLDLVKGICPKLPLPDLSKMSDCGKNCVVQALKTRKCKGPLDTACLCDPEFTNTASGCLINGCGTKDTLAGLDLVKGICPKLPLPDLSKLSDCGKNCVLDTLKKQKCKGPLDSGCLCTADFTNAASQCLISGCSQDDALNGLDLQQSICPNLKLPDLSKLSKCGKGCVISSLQSARCAGPLDNGCICGLNFNANAGSCILLRCLSLGDAAAAVALKLRTCTLGHDNNGAITVGGSAPNCRGLNRLSPLCWRLKRDNGALDTYPPVSKRTARFSA